MERCGFFNAKRNADTGLYDREYDVADFARYFASFIGNGIFPNPSTGLQVAAMEEVDMNIRVQAGQAWYDGFWYENTDDLILPITPADGVLNRIDLVVVRYDALLRDMYLKVLEGVPAVSPIAPQYHRDSDYKDLVLCQIYIAAGVTGVKQSVITDIRLDTEKCGIVVGTVERIDTTTLGAQLNEFVKDFIEDSNRWLADYELQFNNLMQRYYVEKQSEFAEWFDTVKGQLDEDAAGHLQNEFNELSAKFDKTSEDINLKVIEFVNKTVTVREDGTIVEMYEDGSRLETVIDENDNMVRRLYDATGVLKYTHTLTFDDNDNIAEVLTKA